MFHSATRLLSRAELPTGEFVELDTTVLGIPVGTNYMGNYIDHMATAGKSLQPSVSLSQMSNVSSIVSTWN